MALQPGMVRPSDLDLSTMSYQLGVEALTKFQDKRRNLVQPGQSIYFSQFVSPSVSQSFSQHAHARGSESRELPACSICLWPGWTGRLTHPHPHQH